MPFLFEVRLKCDGCGIEGPRGTIEYKPDPINLAVCQDNKLIGAMPKGWVYDGTYRVLLCDICTEDANEEMPSGEALMDAFRDGDG